jgi:endoglucanase
MRFAYGWMMIMVVWGLLFLSSCGKTAETVVPEETIEVPKQMEEAPVLEYEVPTMQPSVFVNREGYSIDSEKLVIVSGKYLPQVFRVVDADTGEVVFTGKLQERGFYSKEEEYTGYGDFSEVEQEGKYYIECDVVGRSYSFEIAEEIERRLFASCTLEMQIRLQQLTLEVSRDAQDSQILGNDRVEWMEALLYLLLAYEIYPQAEGQEDTRTIPQILEVVEEGIQGLVYLQDQETGGVEGHSYLYATILAKYSYLYQQYDSVLANDVLNLADRAWRYGEKRRKQKETGEDEGYRMSAAAELYRATGQYSYRNVILEYGNAMLSEATGRTVSSDDLDQPLSEEEIIGQTLAKITYISTTQRVNVELCNLFIVQLMQEAEYIAAQLGQDFLEDGLRNTGEGDRLFWNLIELSVVEYVITNHEYGQVLKDQYNFLCGRNRAAYPYWSETADDGDKMQIREHPVWMAGFVMLLSEVLTNE